MPATKFIDIDGKRFVWRELLQRRREQLAAAVRVEQPALFELKEDCRPASERTAAGRYSEPSLFAFIAPRAGEEGTRPLNPAEGHIVRYASGIRCLARPRNLAVSDR
jgi:hypothetical protein